MIKFNQLNKKIFGIVMLFAIGFSVLMPSVVGAQAGDDRDYFERNVNSLSFSCEENNILNGMNTVYCAAADIAYRSLFKFTAVILYFSGKAFDFAIENTVYKLKENYIEKEGGGSNVINIVWKIFRNLTYTSLIFVLLYASIKIILGGFSSDVKKIIGSVVLVAILINFSMFFTKIFIDVTNIAAVSIYENLSRKEGETNLSIPVIESISPETLFKIDAKTENDAKKYYMDIIRLSLIGSVVFIFLAIIIFISTLFFVVRLLFIIALILSSSIAFGSLVLPGLKKAIFDKWWAALLGQGLVAPVFMFLFGIYILILRGFVSQTMDWGGLVKADGSTAIAQTLIGFFILIGAGIGILILTKIVSDKAGSSAGKLSGFIGGAALGTSAFAGRKVVGGVGGGLLNNKYTKSLANSDRLITRKFGQSLTLSGNRLQKSTFDARNAKGVSSLLGQAGDFGKGTKQTYEQDTKDRTKKYSERQGVYKEDDLSLKNKKRLLEEKLNAKTEKEERSLQELETKQEVVNQRKEEIKTMPLAEQAIELDIIQKEQEKIDKELEKIAKDSEKRKERMTSKAKKIDEKIGEMSQRNERTKTRRMDRAEGILNNAIKVATLGIVGFNNEAARKAYKEGGKSNKERLIENALKEVEESAKKETESSNK